MKLLLDTHIALWWFAGETERLGSSVVAAVTDAENVFVSAASVWEIEIKRALQKLRAPDDVAEQITASGFRPLGIDIDHAIGAGRLPRHHDDPFDRMLVAQARSERMTLVTSDKRIPAYDVRVMLAAQTPR